MPSLKDVKSKIAGVRKTKQITKAMNMVASAKLRGAQSRVERFRPYADKYYAVLGDLSAKADGAAHPLLEPHPERKVALIILATSDRGLCGGFNAMLIGRALHLARKCEAEGKSVKFVCVGKKGRDAIKKTGYEIQAAYVDTSSLGFSLAGNIGKDLVSNYTSHALDEVSMVYGEFVSLGRQIPVVLPLLPMERNETAKPQDAARSTAAGTSQEYLYEPEVKQLLAELLPRFINVQLYRGLLDTTASEHAARMTAMDNATNACKDIIKDLTRLYNKARQAAVTNELMDIVGGAEALRG